MPSRTNAPDPRDDRALVDAARGGDTAAFDALYRRHRDWVLRMATRVTGDPDAALDVLQEVFVYVLRKLPDLQLRAQFSTFLFPAVRNLALQSRRRRARVEPLASEPAGAPPAAADELAEVVANLTDAQREVVLLRFVDGLSLAEVAAQLALPVGTVKSRLHQALAVLREDPRTRRYFLE